MTGQPLGTPASEQQSFHLRHAGIDIIICVLTRAGIPLPTKAATTAPSTPDRETGPVPPQPFSKYADREPDADDDGSQVDQGEFDGDGRP